jgi:transcriptional regulator GlxA family with amidase domain
VPRIQKVLENLFQKIKGEYEHPDAFSKDYLGCYVSELVLLLARTQHGKAKVSPDSNNFVERAVAYVHQNYMNKLTLVEVAKYCAVSAEHLSRNFKKHTGMGFSEYLTLHRLKCAQEMLFYYPELSISEIAYKCGFNDGNYFSVVYKRWCGVSPSKLNRIAGEENAPKNEG